jgi:hypothetical protein
MRQFYYLIMNITKTTEEYIRTHPHVKQSLKSNIVNYSKLSRLISKETGIKSTDAILVACRRYFRKLKEQQQNAPVMELLKGTKLSIRDKIVVVILEPDSSFESILALQREIKDKNETMHVVRGANAITLITTEDFLDAIKRRFGNSILKTTQNLVEIMMKSNTRLELIPGVMGYVYSLFGENNINIVETLSCWTDTILIIRKDDLAKTMGLLSF